MIKEIRGCRGIIVVIICKNKKWLFHQYYDIEGTKKDVDMRQFVCKILELPGSLFEKIFFLVLRATQFDLSLLSTGEIFSDFVSTRKFQHIKNEGGIGGGREGVEITFHRN